MTAHVIHIGLDAAEADLVEHFASEGSMPNIARLMERATTVPLRPARDLPGAMWVEVATGRFGVRSGVYFPPAQIIDGSAAQVRMTSDYLDTDSWFWQVAARHGKRVASIDMVHAALTECDAFEIVEWGSHDRMISPTGSTPADALAELEHRHGTYPVHSCDTMHKGTRAGYRRLTDNLITGALRKGNLASDVIQRQQWDLASVVFTETHCACHQLWHFHDPTDHRHPHDQPDMHSVVRDVYHHVDIGVGKVVDAAGPDARILLTSIKGAASAVGGPHLVSDVLAGLEMTRPRGWKSRAWDEVPVSIKGQFSRVPLSTRARLGIGSEPGMAQAEGKARALRNDQTGAVRIHIAGRDPGGTIAPGDEADAVLDLIETAFSELRHVPTGRPVVSEIIRFRETYRDMAHPDLPDMAIVFCPDLGPIEEVVSERLGRIRRPLRRIRSGDHTGNARAWLVAPEAPGGRTDERALCDLSATMLTLADVPVPDRYDGTSTGILDG